MSCLAMIDPIRNTDIVAIANASVGRDDPDLRAFVRRIETLPAMQDASEDDIETFDELLDIAEGWAQIQM